MFKRFSNWIAKLSRGKIQFETEPIKPNLIETLGRAAKLLSALAALIITIWFSSLLGLTQVFTDTSKSLADMWLQNMNERTRFHRARAAVLLKKYNCYAQPDLSDCKALIDALAYPEKSVSNTDFHSTKELAESDPEYWEKVKSCGDAGQNCDYCRKIVRDRLISDYRTSIVNTLNTFETISIIRSRWLIDRSTKSLIDRDYARAIIRHTNELWPIIERFRGTSSGEDNALNKEVWKAIDEQRASRGWEDIPCTASSNIPDRLKGKNEKCIGKKDQEQPNTVYNSSPCSAPTPPSTPQ